MTSPMGGAEGERVLQWLEASGTVFEGVRRILREADQCTTALETAQADRGRLQQHCDALREEVRQFQAELARLQRERTESTQWLAATMREMSARFPVTPPPA